MNNQHTQKNEGEMPDEYNFGNVYQTKVRERERERGGGGGWRTKKAITASISIRKENNKTLTLK